MFLQVVNWEDVCMSRLSSPCHAWNKKQIAILTDDDLFLAKDYLNGAELR